MASTPISAPPEGGLAYLDRWRATLRPVPGSVPQEAGFEPFVPASDVDGNGCSPSGATPEDAADLVQRAVAAIERLGTVDLLSTEAAALGDLAAGTEQVRRMSNALATDVAGMIEHRNPFRGQGYLTAKTFLEQRAQLSGAEAYRRVQTARMHDRLGEWAAAGRAGTVGIAQSELMGRVAANPRIESEVLRRDAGRLLDDARTLPFDEFERRLRAWEPLADPTGDDDRRERLRARRTVDLHPRPDGGWSITGELPELDRVEFAQIFGAFVDSEWRADWAEAGARLGDDATRADLRRTEAHRRADALLAMARAAITNPVAGATRSNVTVNILFDETIDGSTPRRHRPRPPPRRLRLEWHHHRSRAPIPTLPRVIA